MTQIITWDRSMSSLGPAAVAIGVFDGVHLGHQTLIRDTIEFGRTLGSASAVVTFDQDPDRVVSPDSAVPQLLDLADKLTFLAALGTDSILVVPFDATLAAMCPEEFLQDVLLGAFDPVATIVGHDFRFGCRASGDVGTLERFGSEHGFTVIAHELVTLDGLPVTSTRVRSAVAAGDMLEASRLLGRPHRLRGTVVHGRGEGAALGVPTANLEVHHEAAVPADGVYAGYTIVDDTRVPAAISLGLPPTFPHASARVEAHLIGWEGELYGREIVVELIERVRAQRQFDSLSGLAEAIAHDIVLVEAMLSREDPA